MEFFSKFMLVYNENVYVSMFFDSLYVLFCFFGFNFSLKYSGICFLVILLVWFFSLLLDLFYCGWNKILGGYFFI